MRFVVINKDPKAPIYLIDEPRDYNLGISHIKVFNDTTQICMSNGENILVTKKPLELITELWPEGEHEFTTILTPLPKAIPVNKKKVPDDIGNKKGQ